MTIAIVSLIIIAYMLIANEHITRINKATIAMFTGVVVWILYMSTATSFTLKMHGAEFNIFSQGMEQTSELVKKFIASHVFIRYGADLCGIVLYLLATMNIVSVLSTNGCFDFITNVVRARNSRRILWGLVAFTCLISVNLDNLTTTVLMLLIPRSSCGRREPSPLRISRQPSSCQPSLLPLFPRHSSPVCCPNILISCVPRCSIVATSQH